MYTQEPPNRLRLRVVRLLHIIGLAVIDLQYVPKIRTEINTLRSDGGGDGTRHIFVYHLSFHAVITRGILCTEVPRMTHHYSD